MPSFATFVAAVVMISGVRYAHGQSVLIPNTTPPAVLDRLKVQLVPQGFKLEQGDANGALFTLDRGMVAQNARPMRGALVHTVIELQLRFKARKDGLQVSASEEVVGDAGRSAEFRKPVRSQAELDSMQRLLELIRADLAAGDSTTKRDST